MGVNFSYRPIRMEITMAQERPLNEGQFIKVPFWGDLERGAHIKLPTPEPQYQPTQVPAQPAQPQTGGTNDGK
jgi:hypothetical protein